MPMQTSSYPIGSGCLILPLQGKADFGQGTQGVALGSGVVPPFGADAQMTHTCQIKSAFNQPRFDWTKLSQHMARAAA